MEEVVYSEFKDAVVVFDYIKVLNLTGLYSLKMHLKNFILEHKDREFKILYQSVVLITGIHPLLLIDETSLPAIVIEFQNNDEVHKRLCVNESSFRKNCKARSTSKPDSVYRCHFSPKGYIPRGLVGLSLSYALALTNAHVFFERWYCGLANYVISVERIRQYMHIPPEPPLQQLRRIGHHLFGLQRVELSSRMSSNDIASRELWLEKERIRKVMLTTGGDVGAIALRYTFNATTGMVARALPVVEP
ncbi:hypothetical protein Tco_0983553 [Tanacetum coccineum]